jgi:hypothetical protein
VRYDPSLEARHDARPTMLGWLGRKFVYGSGGAGLAKRHGNKLAPAVLTPGYALAAAAILNRTRWAAPITAVAVATGTRSVRAVLPPSRGRTTVSARLAVRGLGWAVRQESALVLRHWWPLTVGALFSTRLRRVVVTALLVDAVEATRESRGTHSGLGATTIATGRRLSDLAYGAGLWWGALRAGSPRALLPRRPSSHPPASKCAVVTRPEEEPLRRRRRAAR